VREREKVGEKDGKRRRKKKRMMMQSVVVIVGKLPLFH